MSHSELNTTHDPRRQSWVESANAAETDFPLQNLPYGVFEHEGQVSWGVAIGSQVLDVRALANLHLLHSDAWVAAQSVQGHELNALMGLEPAMLHALRLSLSALLGADTPSDEFNASSQKKIKRLSKVLLLERDLAEPDRIVAELLQPGGYLKLRELGLADCIEDIDAQRVTGYVMFKQGERAQLNYPTHNHGPDVTGVAFHNGRFVQRLRHRAAAVPSVRKPT